MEKEEGPRGGLTQSNDSSSESQLKLLRGRWELASVLNFFNVFEPVIKDKLKLTAEEIEMGLVESNSTNARLHVALLKGIPPVDKSLDNSDAWITVMCEKLAPWWPWIAEGDMPITANKGEEISEYQGLDPTNRLLILKALCELRAEQDDAISYIHSNVKQGTEVSYFRKEKLGGHGKKTSYWFDGNDIQGYRLYKEVNITAKKSNVRRNTCVDLSLTGCHWETLATNLEEFYKVSKELSSSKGGALVAIGQMIENDAVPVVEKYLRKKERAMKKKLKQEKVANMCYPMRRSSRNRTLATYTLNECDRMINVAVDETDDSDGHNEERRKRKLEQVIVISEDDETTENESDKDPKEGGYNGNGKGEDSEAVGTKEQKNREMCAKYRLRQRVTRNLALL